MAALLLGALALAVPASALTETFTPYPGGGATATQVNVWDSSKPLPHFVVGTHSVSSTGQFVAQRGAGLFDFEQAYTGITSLGFDGTFDGARIFIGFSDGYVFSNTYQLRRGWHEFTDFSEHGNLLNFGVSGTGKASAVLDKVVWDGNRISGAVPEPASWVLMIAGFGMIGSVARRHRAGLASA